MLTELLSQTVLSPGKRDPRLAQMAHGSLSRVLGGRDGRHERRSCGVHVGTPCERRLHLHRTADHRVSRRGRSQEGPEEDPGAEGRVLWQDTRVLDQPGEHPGPQLVGLGEEQEAIKPIKSTIIKEAGFI